MPSLKHRLGFVMREDNEYLFKEELLNQDRFEHRLSFSNMDKLDMCMGFGCDAKLLEITKEQGPYTDPEVMYFVAVGSSTGNYFGRADYLSETGRLEIHENVAALQVADVFYTHLNPFKRNTP